jgi:hypothetical protein
MALARIDLLVQALAFHNIDLQMQGIYRIRFTTPDSANINKFEDLGGRTSTPPEASEHSYLTKKLEVQFLDEVIEIKEIIRIQYQVELTQLAQPHFLSVTLIYYGLDFEICKELLTIHLEITGFDRGLFEHAVISFDCVHSCCFTANFYSVLSSIKVPRAPAFAAAIFQDSRGNSKRLVGAAEADETYKRYTGALKELHNSLYKFLHNLTCNSEGLSELPDQGLESTEKQLNVHDAVLIAEEMLSEFMVWTTRMALLTSCLLESMRVVPSLLTQLLQAKSYSRYQELISNTNFFSVCSVNQHISLKSRQDATTRKKSFAKSLRHSWKYEPFYGVRVAGAINPNLLFFEETFNESRSFRGTTIQRLPTAKERHVVVLVHGYQGTHVDMRNVKAGLLGAFPNLTVHVIESLGELTDFDIFEQGRAVATEVRNYLSLKPALPSKLSFIGHSMGGLVVRAALPLLQEYSGIMQVYCSLNTPHLGFFERPSALVGTGLWLFKVMKKTISLDQLVMKDHVSPTKTTLFRLSETPGLEWFQNVILVGSHQDLYTPLESALVEVPERVVTSNPEFVHIARNLLSRMKSLSRIDISYKFKRGFVDQLLGRAAHVECLDNQAVMRLLALKFYSLW